MTAEGVAIAVLVGTVGVMLVLLLLERHERRRQTERGDAAYLEATRFMERVAKDQADRERELLTIARVPEDQVGMMLESMRANSSKTSEPTHSGEDVLTRDRRIWRTRGNRQAQERHRA